MPAVRLTYYECEHGLLPPVCAAGGEPADTAVRFLIPNRWFLYAVGVLSWVCPPLLIAFVTYWSRRWPMRVPMCQRHRAEFRRFDRVFDWTYLVWVGGGYVGAIVGLAVLPDRRWEEGFVLIAVGYCVLVLCWMVPVSLVQTRYVRTTQATRRDIRLSGVHEEFVRAVREDRARDPNPDRLAAYGDVRDDYDDERA